MRGCLGRGDARKSQPILWYSLGVEKITLEQLSALVMAQAKEKGFGTKPEEVNVGEKIALIQAEISEAYEAYRHKNMHGEDGFKEEMGDAIQRILHLCGILNIDVSEAILEKLHYNEARTWDWKKMNETHS